MLSVAVWVDEAVISTFLTLHEQCVSTDEAYRAVGDWSPGRILHSRTRACRRRIGREAAEARAGYLTRDARVRENPTGGIQHEFFEQRLTGVTQPICIRSLGQPNIVA
jgi:hypothetical protein